MNLFLDSSALVKRYVEEPGSERVVSLLSAASSLGFSVLAFVEVSSILCRRRREGKLTPSRYQKAKHTLYADVADASLVYVTESVVARAVDLLERWPLRSLDALHVASAAEWKCDIFVSADLRQCAAAKGFGLHVENIPAG